MNNNDAEKAGKRLPVTTGNGGKDSMAEDMNTYLDAATKNEGNYLSKDLKAVNLNEGGNGEEKDLSKDLLPSKDEHSRDGNKEIDLSKDLLSSEKDESSQDVTKDLSKDLLPKNSDTDAHFVDEDEQEEHEN